MCTSIHHISSTYKSTAVRLGLKSRRYHATALLLFRETAEGALNAVIHLGATSRVAAFDEPYERLLRWTTILSEAAGTPHDDRIKKVEQYAVAANFTASDLPQEHIQMNFSLFVDDAYALRGKKEHEPTKIQVVQVLLGFVSMFASVGATPPPHTSCYRRRNSVAREIAPAHRVTRRFVASAAVDRAAEQEDRERIFLAKDSYRPFRAVKSAPWAHLGYKPALHHRAAHEGSKRRRRWSRGGRRDGGGGGRG